MYLMMQRKPFALRPNSIALSKQVNRRRSPPIARQCRVNLMVMRTRIMIGYILDHRVNYVQTIIMCTTKKSIKTKKFMYLLNADQV